MKNTPFDSFLSPRLPREFQLQRLRRVIREELTRPQQEILRAYYFREQTVSQIARERNVHRSTVYRTLRRAEEKLRRFLLY